MAASGMSMNVTSRSNSTSLRDLVEQKEKEWKDAQDLRIKSLEVTLQEKEKQLHNERVRFRKLKEDFEYNLKLVEERDSELERYDALFSEVKNIDSVRNAEVSELKIKLDDLKSKLGQEEKAQEELQRHYQQRLREHQQELNQFRLAKEADVKKEREEFESFKREFQRHLRAAEEDVETQRQELMSGFDGALQKKEHEFRLKLDEMSNSLLASDLKVKMLAKELELVRTSDVQTKCELQNSTTSVQELEKVLKQKEWELTDERNMNSARVRELEAKIEQIVQSKKRAQESFQHKQAELDRYVREKEAALVAAKEAHHQHEMTLEGRMRELQGRLETQEVECRRLEWAHNDSVKEKEVQVQRLQNTVAELQSKIEHQLSEQGRLTVAKDLELEALKQQEEKMRVEIAQRKEDLDRYKKELTMALEREAALERSKTQLVIDWQRRCDDTEREALCKQEGLVTSLTRARDEAVALAKDRERQLIQREDLIRVLTESRDQAIATLQRHGLSVPTQLPSRDLNHMYKRDLSYAEHKSSADEDMSLAEKARVLEKRNEGLRGVIRHMRQEMEELTSQVVGSPPSVMSQLGDDEQGGAPVPLTTEYVKSLESEIRGLRSKNRSLTLRVEELSQVAKPLASTDSLTKKMADPYLQTHIRELNNTIGSLRQEKLDLQAQIRKHQATASHMQGLLIQCQEEVRQKQLAVDQLKYELATEARRTADQLSAHKQKIADLELQLAQVRHGADEYYKSGLERNLEATALGNQVSSLKLHLVSQGHTDPTHFNPQAAIIRELQNEIQQLRSHQIRGSRGGDGAGPSLLLNTAGESGAVLRTKLKSAAQRISQLARDKEQLIQMGNRLRAELARATGPRQGGPGNEGGQMGSRTDDHLSHSQYGAPTVGSVTPGEIADQLHGQLNAVERLQYQLTTHELQYAKQQARHQQIAADQAKVTVVSSSSSSETSPPSDRRETKGCLSPNPDKYPSQLHPATNHVPQASRSKPAVTTSQQASTANEQTLFTSSSEGQASLQEIWKLLDEEESFRSSTPGALFPGPSPQDSVPRSQFLDRMPSESTTISSEFAVKGRQAVTELKPSAKRPGLSWKAAGKAKLTPQKPKIRNYNVRDNV